MEDIKAFDPDEAYGTVCSFFNMMLCSFFVGGFLVVKVDYLMKAKGCDFLPKANFMLMVENSINDIKQL